MENALILETGFIVDLERERRALPTSRRGGARAKAPAHQFLANNPSANLLITMITVGEIAAGIATEERGRWEGLVSPFGLLGVDDDVCWQYGIAFRYLARQGKLIGSNDLWIAAIAVAHHLPLVTRDEGHFARVPGLRVIRY